MDRDAGAELIASILNTAASMQMLEYELDRISIHSSPGSQPSNSRESLRSSSKYDSAFDSHYSEDTLSQNSQSLATSCPVEASILPSMILTPPLPYRVVTATEELAGSHSPYSYQDYIEKKLHAKRSEKDPTCLESAVASDPPSPSLMLSTSQHTQHDPTPPAVHHVYATPSSPHPASSSLHRSPAVDQAVRNRVEAITPPSKGEITPNISVVSSVTPTTRSRTHDSPSHSNVEGATTTTTVYRHRTSESSSTSSELVSNDSTPTTQRKHPHVDDHVPPLTPTVIIITGTPHSSEFDQKHIADSPLPKHTYFPKTGTLFYQESLTPQASPLHKTPSHRTPSSTLPLRYRDSLRNPHQETKNLPKRSGSILQRFKRKRGSFKEEGVLKRRLPVKRSFSDRLTYHIKKGWIDYEEDLELVSHPTHPRQVGRMIDKKAGQYHMVQLYKPASGRYGIYISQNGIKVGVFISRFANSTAEKFYSGLITPGDQIIRVNGKNIKEQSVDDVYDLMTESSSVIFTVIPVNSRPHW